MSGSSPASPPGRCPRNATPAARGGPTWALLRPYRDPPDDALERTMRASARSIPFRAGRAGFLGSFRASHRWATITGMQVAVIRHSFYHSHSAGQQHLRFDEHTPTAQHDAPGCCCTRPVSSRPEGRPDEIQQHILIEGAVEGMLCDVHLVEPSFKFWSTRRPLSPLDHPAHASFRFERDVLHASLPLPGYGLTDHFFATLYRGNKIDTSTLMNGHAPSRVVDLRTIGPNQLWLHDCSWGNEAIRMMPEGREADTWRRLMDMASDVRCAALLYADQKHLDVHALRDLVAKDEQLLNTIQFMRHSLGSVARLPTDTTLFRLGDQIHRQIDAASGPVAPNDSQPN